MNANSLLSHNKAEPPVPILKLLFKLIHGLSLTCIEYINLNGSIHCIVCLWTIPSKGVYFCTDNNCGMIDPLWSSLQANCPIHLKTKLQFYISICYSNKNTLSAMKPRYASANFFKDTSNVQKMPVITYVRGDSRPGVPLRVNRWKCHKNVGL